jgi:hypothetical protein
MIIVGKAVFLLISNAGLVSQPAVDKWPKQQKYPTVIIMTAMHTREQLEKALETLQRVGKRMGIIP